MNDDMRLRSAINLDELERQLREAASSRGSSARSVPPVDDPLAELARLVGHAEPAQEPPQPGYAGFGTASAPAARQGYAPQPEPERPYSAPESYAYPQDDYRRPPAYAQGAPLPEQAAYPEADPYFEGEGTLERSRFEEEEEAPKPRKTGLYILAAMAVVAAGGVGIAAWMKRDAPKPVAANAPVIAADTSPAKVPAPNPGGTEVPNQNTQIYNRNAPDDTKTAKVVPSEEQPVDVVAAQRLAGNAATANRPGASLGMGEPKKVRSVTVRPDGSIVEDGVPARLPAVADPTRPQMPPPAAASSGAVTPSRPAPSTSVAVPGTPPTGTATTTTTAGATRPMPPSRPEPAETPAAPAAPAQRTVVAAAPPAPAAQPAPPVAAPAPQTAAALPTADAGSGEFAVQLAAPGSEAEARDAVAKLQQRFGSVLGGYPLAARKAEVNGKSIYRVRVGGLSREEAVGLCEKLKSSGGQCFVARN